MSSAQTEQRTQAQLREHFTIERELADRLRYATRDQRRSLYSAVYDEYIARVAPKSEDRDIWACDVAPQERLLAPFITPEAVLLEVGAGDGALAMSLAKRAKQVYAVDVAQYPMPDGARPANFEFYLFDGIDVGLPANTVSLAYSNQVMEHLHAEDAYDQLRSIFQTLKPGGRYICITPNRLSGPHDISKYFSPVATGLHLKEYTITELTNIFRQVGFSHVQIVLTYKGHRLSPLLPAAPFVYLEAVLERIPVSLRRFIGPLLTAAKPVAVK